MMELVIFYLFIFTGIYRILVKCKKLVFSCFLHITVNHENTTMRQKGKTKRLYARYPFPQQEYIYLKSIQMIKTQLINMK